ncbi:putative uncharacterized protein [Anaerotruncus sp. CAG:528]|nr:putative uncharacterized protein [Anaerotruncus sp. CAG:528]
MIFIAKSIAGGGVFKTYSGSDITRINGFDIFSVVCVHLKNTADSFFIALNGVVNLRACIKSARINAEVANFTYKRVGGNLECKSRERLAVGRMTEFFLIRVGVYTLD